MSRIKGLSTALAVLFVLGTAVESQAQYGRTKAKPDASPGAVSSQVIGINSTISVSYHRPAVKEREVWGTDLAPFGDEKPWRAGANETTTVTFSDDVTVNGQDVPAGTYGFHVALSEDKWVFVLNKNYKTWGTYQYKIEDDVLRVEAKVADAPHQERLLFGFDNLTADGADLFLHWETKHASVTVALKK